MDAHKVERNAFANWTRTNSRKEQTTRILFSNEKNFDIDKIYNLHNDRVWAPSRSEANERGRIIEKRKFPQKAMVWFGAHAQRISLHKSFLKRVP